MWEPIVANPGGFLGKTKIERLAKSMCQEYITLGDFYLFVGR